VLDINRELSTTRPHALRDAVRLVLADPSADVIDFRLEELPAGAGNPTSAGLWRAKGFARSAGDVVEWSLVIKAVTLPTDTVFDHDDPTFLNYWRREIDVFRSAVLRELPAGLERPAFYGDVDLDLADRYALLFMEDLGAISRDEWKVDSYLFAAGRLAAWERPWLRAAQDVEPWLRGDVSRNWVALARNYYDHYMSLAQAGDPALAAFSLQTCDPVVRPLLRLINDPESLLAPLDRLPQVMCHNDPNIDNLVIRRAAGQEPSLVMFDVQWVSTSGVGTELGQLLTQVPTSMEGLTRIDIERQVIDAYLAELNADESSVTRAQVEFGFSASAALRQFHFAAALLGEEMDAAIDAGDADVVRELAAGFIEGIKNGPLPRLAARAYELAAAI
jgi:hypothetical protein